MKSLALLLFGLKLSLTFCGQNVLDFLCSFRVISHPQWVSNSTPVNAHDIVEPLLNFDHHIRKAREPDFTGLQEIKTIS